MLKCCISISGIKEIRSPGCLVRDPPVIWSHSSIDQPIPLIMCRKITQSYRCVRQTFTKIIYHSIPTAQLRIRAKRETGQRRGGAAKKARPNPGDFCVEDDF